MEQRLGALGPFTRVVPLVKPSGLDHAAAFAAPLLNACLFPVPLHFPFLQPRT